MTPMNPSTPTTSTTGKPRDPRPIYMDHNATTPSLPEVIEAMNNASYYPVNFDELMEGAGKRIQAAIKEVAASAPPPNPAP